MAKSKRQAEQPKPKQHEAVEAYSAILDALPKGKMAMMFRDASLLEHWLRRGLAGLQLLEAIRSYILDPQSAMGGEESPFVKKIDQLIPRV